MKKQTRSLSCKNTYVEEKRERKILEERLRFNMYEKEYIVSYESYITILADLKVRECNKMEC